MQHRLRMCPRVLVKFKKRICSIVIAVISIYTLVTLLLPHLSAIDWHDVQKHSLSLRYLENLPVGGSQNGSIQQFRGFIHSNTTTVTKKHMMITLSEFQKGHKTGNPLIDDYGKNNIKEAGELGRGVVLTNADRNKADEAMKLHNINTVVSDAIPLNRLVPDSRIRGCDKLQYASNLPTASIIIPFYNEWPSVLLRTVYSVINRSPRHLVKEIILVDDASTLESLQKSLEAYIDTHFPQGLVRLVRMPERLGLIKARMQGSKVSAGDVLVFFDSHMEVNIDWLPPLLTEIVRDRKNVAMATLDYVQADTFEYKYNFNYLTRYGWDWSLIFFETFFRHDQIGPETTSPRPGATMVGAAFAIDRKYFFEIGGYDEGMKVWGGENLEMSWRVWLCGGRLLHVPCSRIGHVPRSQPYTFPGGRQSVEDFNYKRAISVWMGNYSRFVYHTRPTMKHLDVGDISDRLAIKSKLGCKDFKWYLDNVWPELNVPDENVTVWGEVFSQGTGLCLDNAGYLFQALEKLTLSKCNNKLVHQAFSLTNDSLLRTTLQCVVAHGNVEDADVKIEDCIIGSRDKWNYLQKNQSLVHLQSGLCLDIAPKGPVLKKCQSTTITQKWMFRPYNL